jgi:osmoprotectant transport system permease protein
VRTVAIQMVVGSVAGIAVTRPAGQAFKPIVDALAVMGQTFPPAAVQLVGLLALALYGVWSVLQATVAGPQAVPQPMQQAARGLGLSPWQALWQLEVPLALPVWLAGVRASVRINIGTAAIASTVGAKTLVSPIIVGLSGFNTAYILQGVVLVGLLAVVVDMAFERVARRVAWRA